MTNSQTCEKFCLWRSALTQGWRLWPNNCVSGTPWWISKAVLASVFFAAQIFFEFIGTQALVTTFALLIQGILFYPLLRSITGKISPGVGKIVFLFGAELALILGLSDPALYGNSLWPSPVTVSSLALIALALVTAAEQKLTALLALRQQSSLLPSVPPTAFRIGEQILIKSGEIIPRDGIIIQGVSSVDESPITGMKRPVLKARGDRVFSASVNRDSDILIEITGDPHEDTIAKLAELRDKSLESIPAPQKLSLQYEIFVSLFLVLSAAIQTVLLITTQQQAIAPALFTSLPILFLAPLSLSFLHKLTFSLMGHGAFARRIILKNLSLLDKLSRVKALFFNKTGTLTSGEFLFSQAFIEKGTNMGGFLATLFSLESHSDHPLAYAMETHPWHPEITQQPVRDFQTHPGLGVCGTLKYPDGNGTYFAAVGNLRFVKRHRFNVSWDMKAKVDELEDMGDTVVLCGFDRQVRGIMSFSDLLRPDIGKTLRRIQKLGIETSLITGDTEKSVTHLIGKLGLKKVYSRCTPEEKAGQIEKERASGQIVAMVGRDFDNESAFEKADVSLALDTGVNFLNHHADILVLGRDIRLLSWLFEIAIAARRILNPTLMGHAGLTMLLAFLGFLGWLPAPVAVILSAGWMAVSAHFINKWLTALPDQNA